MIARHDYHPFGEEIDAAASPQRTEGLGYTTDEIRKKFTGYERDDETGLDFAQTRYFNSGIGRFSSPDSFTNDTYVSNPQSWNLYAYVRNNPLNMIDPFGKKGTISWYTDDDGKVHVKISATFAVYGAKGQNVSMSNLARYKNALIDGIKKHLTQNMEVDGKKISMTVDVSAKIFKSEAGAIASKSDNIVEMGYGDVDSKSSEDKNTVGMAFGVKGENFDRMVLKISPDPNEASSLDPISGTEITGAHETAAHLLGGSHNGSESTSLFYGQLGTSDPQVTQNDMRRLLVGTEIGPPPPPVGRTAMSLLSPSGSEQRWANRRDFNHATDAYTWKNNVKK